MQSNRPPLRGGIGLPLLAFGALALSASAALANAHVDLGKKLFESHCAVCHKRDASGGISLGDTKSADLQSPGLEKMYHNNDKLIRRAIEHGIDEEGDKLDAIMPRWSGRLTDSQVTDIIAFLHTVKTKD
jgi:mono/diheme cytochrome c family protein